MNNETLNGIIGQHGPYEVYKQEVLFGDSLLLTIRSTRTKQVYSHYFRGVCDDRTLRSMVPMWVKAFVDKRETFHLWRAKNQ